MKYSVIDLFAGAGGLSYGFEATGNFEIKVAVEKNENAQKTFKRNHISATVLEDVCTINYKELLMEYGDLDIVIGGPPCQGFSNTNRQRNHAISLNNKLVKEYVRAITELKPKAFVMENVSMIQSDVHRFYLAEGENETINMYKIGLRNDKISLLPKHLMLTSQNLIFQNQDAKYIWSERTYNIFNIIFKTILNKAKLEKVIEKHRKQIMNACLEIKTDQTDEIFDCYNVLVDNFDKYFAGELILDRIVESLERPIFLQRMFRKLKEINDNSIIIDKISFDNGIEVSVKTYSVSEYLLNILTSEDFGYVVCSDVLNAADFGVPQKRKRFIVIGIRKDYLEGKKIEMPVGKFINQNRTVRNAIEDIEQIKPTYDVIDSPIILTARESKEGSLSKKLRDSNLLSNHIITKTREDALRRFESLKPGENFHDLKTELKENTYSNAARTQNTIYLRLDYDKPCGTVVNVRKSMWIHPKYDRAISVREAARLQTFPDSFIFVGTKDSQYQQVGNAVPPILAEAIAKKVVTLLKGSQKFSG